MMQQPGRPALELARPAIRHLTVAPAVPALGGLLAPSAVRHARHAHEAGCIVCRSLACRLRWALAKVNVVQVQSACVCVCDSVEHAEQRSRAAVR